MQKSAPAPLQEIQNTVGRANGRRFYPLLVLYPCGGDLGAHHIAILGGVGL